MVMMMINGNKSDNDYSHDEMMMINGDDYDDDDQ